MLYRVINAPLKLCFVLHCNYLFAYLLSSLIQNYATAAVPEKKSPEINEFLIEHNSFLAKLFCKASRHSYHSRDYLYISIVLLALYNFGLALATTSIKKRMEKKPFIYLKCVNMMAAMVPEQNEA